MRKRIPHLLGTLLEFVSVLAGGGLLALLALSVLPVRAQTTGSLSPTFVAEKGVALLNAAPTVSAANTAATVTLTGAAGARVCVRGVYIQATGAAATFTLTVQDGATVILNLGTQTATNAGPALAFTGTPLFCGTAGNNVVVNVGAGGASAVTTTSVIADRS